MDPAGTEIVHTAPLVLAVGLVLLLSATLGMVARRLGLPAIIGYLLTGLLVSPLVHDFVAGATQIAVLADIGVVLLLFEVGIEVDIRRIGRENGAVLWAVPLQVVLGTAAAAAVLMALGVPQFGALMLGLGISMSSSVVIVNITRSRRRTTNPATEDALLGWSVLQDICGVATAAVLLTIFEAGDRSAAVAIAQLFGFAVLAYLVARFMPRLLQQVRWENDLFLIFSVATALALSALGAVAFGVPMALAAFVAGLVVNQERDTAEVRRVLLPFRDLFAVLFFVVIGTLIELTNFVAALPFTIVLIGMLIGFKTVPIWLLARLAKLKARPGQLAVGMSQVGEFSFVLASVAVSAGALSQVQFTAALSTVVASIVGSTLLVRLLPRQRSLNL